MKILPIQNHKINNIKFKGLCLYSGIYTPEPDEFVKSSSSIDIARLKVLRIPKFRLIDSTSVRGATLASAKPAILRELKESGIERVIDLRVGGGLETDYAKRCIENGLGYFNLPIASTVDINPEKSRIENIVSIMREFFEIMNKGKNYVACLLGLHRTDFATVLNYLMNPKEPSSPPILSHIYFNDEKNCTDEYIGKVKKIFKRTNEKDFAEVLKARIIKLRMKNGL